MTFGVDDEGASSNDVLAEPDAMDFAILAATGLGTGVVSGCAVTAQGTPGLSVAVASGTVRIAKTNVAVTGGNVTITPDGTQGAIALITVDGSGTKAATMGTLGAPYVHPVIDLTTKAVLAAVWVPAAATAITTAFIRQKDVPMDPDAYHAATHAINAAVHTGTLDDAQIPAAIARDAEVTTAVTTHAGAADPHGDRAFATAADAAIDTLTAALKLTGKISPAAISGNVDDYNPANLHTTAVLRLTTNNTTSRNISGLNAAGTDGETHIVHNIGTGNLAFLDDNAGSAAANRFALAGDMILLPDASCVIFYDLASARWRVAARATAATNPSTTYGSSNVGGTSPYFLRADDQLLDPTIAHAALSDPHTGYQQESEKNAASGYAGLDAGTKLAASQLPNPSSSTLGGVQSKASVSHQFLNAISTSGVPAAAAPALTDLSDVPGSAKRGTILRATSAQGAADSTTSDAVEWAAPSGMASQYGLQFSDDFLSNAAAITTSNVAVGPLITSVTGTAAQLSFAALAGTPNHPGVCKLETGTTTTGRLSLQTSLTAISLGGGRCRWGAWIYVPTLSVVGNRFEVVAGFADQGTGGAIVDGCYIHYRDDINSGKWEAITEANSVTTATVTDTGITVTAATWYYLEANVAADGSTVTYYINGTAVVTHSANVPTGAGRETGFVISILKSLGTTNEFIYLDAYYVNLGFTTAR